LSYGPQLPAEIKGWTATGFSIGALDQAGKGPLRPSKR